MLVVKNPPAIAGNIRDVCLLPGLWRSPGGGPDNPLQCSFLENPMDRRACSLQSMGSQRVGHDWSNLPLMRAHTIHNGCRCQSLFLFKYVCSQHPVLPCIPTSFRKHHPFYDYLNRAFYLILYKNSEFSPSYSYFKILDLEGNISNVILLCICMHVCIHVHLYLLI